MCRIAHTLIPNDRSAYVPTKEQAKNNRIVHPSPWNQRRAGGGRGTNSQGRQCELTVDFLSLGSRGPSASYVSISEVYGVADNWTVGKTHALIRKCRLKLAVNPSRASPHPRTRIRIHWAQKSQRSVTCLCLLQAVILVSASTHPPPSGTMAAAHEHVMALASECDVPEAVMTWLVTQVGGGQAVTDNRRCRHHCPDLGIGRHVHH